MSWRLKPSRLRSEHASLPIGKAGEGSSSQEATAPTASGEGSPARKQRRQGTGAGGGATAATGKAAAKPKSRQEKNDAVRSLVMLMAKLCLQNTQLLRDLSSVVVQTFMFKSDNEVMEAGRAAGTAYSEQVKDKEHTLGPPFPHIFVACLEVLSDMSKLGAKTRDKLKAYMKWSGHPKTGVEEMCSHVKLFRISRTYRKDRLKLQVAFADRQPEVDSKDDDLAEGLSEAPPAPPNMMEFNRSFLKAIRGAGGEQKQGRAPAGELERLISKGFQQLDDDDTMREV